MLEYDIGIIGGGPIGGFVAGKIAAKNFNVAVFEKNREIGIPLNCAGLVTPRVFDFIDISKNKVVQNTIKGANINSPSGKILTIGGDKVHAVVIDRIIFDKEIMKKSEKKGAELFLNNNVLSAQKVNSYIEIKTSKNIDAKCKLIIGADGPYSIIRNKFAFPHPLECLKGFGAEVINTNLNPNFIEIFVGNNIAPGFFAWIIPTNKNGSEARIGLCINQNSSYSPKYYLSNFLKNKKSQKFFENIKIKKCIGGVIPLGALKKTYISNVMLVGDSAAQVKPTSGGGIYTGILCGNHCSNVAIEALEKNIFISQFLKKYHKKWTADIGKELFLGMKFRNIFKSLSDKEFDKYIEKFSDSKLVEIISKYGDIDYPSKLIRPLLLKAPALLKFLPNIIK